MKPEIFFDDKKLYAHAQKQMQWHDEQEKYHSEKKKKWQRVMDATKEDNQQPESPLEWSDGAAPGIDADVPIPVRKNTKPSALLASILEILNEQQRPLTGRQIFNNLIEKEKYDAQYASLSGRLIEFEEAHQIYRHTIEGERNKTKFWYLHPNWVSGEPSKKFYLTQIPNLIKEMNGT